MPGRIIVLGGPSGSGKSTAGEILERNMGWPRLVTVTTRQPRPGEVHGRDYYFITPDEFARADAAGELGEKTEYLGNGLAYGIFLADMVAADGRDGHTYVILDRVGLQCLREFYGPGRVTGVFLWARRGVLAERMRARGDDELTIRRRLQRYREEIASGAAFDYRVDTSDLAPGQVASAVWQQVGFGMRSEV